MPCLGLQLVLLATAIISASWAQDGSLNLTLTAKEAVKLYIDGVLHDLPNERNMSATDTIEVSRTSRLLAFQCINLLPTCPGIIASITGDYFLSNSSWKCFEISGGETWTDLGFDDSHWPNATEHQPNKNQTDGSQCSNVLPYVPSISENAFWVWMEDTVQDIIYCRGYLPVCSSSPCQNGATCNVNEVEQCTCIDGYTGYYCETEINECDSGPCLNGATCQDLLNDFECSCAAGSTGIRCETEINECDSGPCLNGATCQDLLNAFECSCAAGYTGIRCETEISECDSGPCLNGATCQDLLNAFECSCAAGYTGIRCETNINECDSGPCQNGATCQDLLNAFECSCAAGYMGIRCETVSVTLIVTADRSLVLLYVDNLTYPLRNSTDWTAPDHIAIPASSSLIAIRAISANEENCSGILGSIDAEIVTNAYWKCSTDNTPGWHRTDFNDSHWPQAVIYDSNTSPFQCQYRHQIQEISPSANWIWTNDTGVSINCRFHLDAYIELTVTGDRALIFLYVDGVSETLNTTTSNSWSQTETIRVHRSTTLVAIRASYASTPTCSGIILCSAGDYFLTDVNWKCSTDNTPGWYSLDYDDSAWPNAVDHGLNSPPFQCPYRYELPEISSNAHWIYTAAQSESANCRGYLP